MRNKFFSRANLIFATSVKVAKEVILKNFFGWKIYLSGTCHWSSSCQLLKMGFIHLHCDTNHQMNPAPTQPHHPCGNRIYYPWLFSPATPHLTSAAHLPPTPYQRASIWVWHAQAQHRSVAGWLHSGRAAAKGLQPWAAVRYGFTTKFRRFWFVFGLRLATQPTCLIGVTIRLSQLGIWPTLGGTVPTGRYISRKIRRLDIFCRWLAQECSGASLQTLETVLTQK